MAEIERRPTTADNTGAKTSQKLLDDSQGRAPHPVTDMAGRECKRQPGAAEVDERLKKYRQTLQSRKW